MNIKMKKYLLFAYGNFESEIVCENLIDVVSQVTHSDFLKFKFDKTYIYFHFETDFQYENIVEFINANFINVADCHILTEYTDKTSVKMNPIDTECFLTLNMSESEKKSLKKISDDIIQINQINADLIFDELLSLSEDSFNEDAEEFYKVTNLKPTQKHNLDEILDKVKQKGRASLTKEEIEFLKTV